MSVTSAEMTLTSEGWDNGDLQHPSLSPSCFLVLVSGRWASLQSERSKKLGWKQHSCLWPSLGSPTASTTFYWSSSHWDWLKCKGKEVRLHLSMQTAKNLQPPLIYHSRGPRISTRRTKTRIHLSESLHNMTTLTVVRRRRRKRKDLSVGLYLFEEHFSVDLKSPHE